MFICYIVLLDQDWFVQLREERRQELEDHVKQINELLKTAATPDPGEGESDNDDESWNGIQDDAPLELVDHEAEYVDEDRYTTVTVEAVDVSKDGLHSIADAGNLEEYDKDHVNKNTAAEITETVKKKWPKKEKKKKFHYESKAERKITREKQMAGKKLKAAQRQSNGWSHPNQKFSPSWDHMLSDFERHLQCLSLIKKLKLSPLTLARDLMNQTSHTWRKAYE